MRIVAVTDIHGNNKAVKRLVEGIKETPDAILIAGDITHFSDSKSAENVLAPLLDTGIRIVAVHGNCDGKDVPELLERLGISAHNRRVQINGMGVVGIGGSNITPFHTIWELEEDEIARVLERNYQEGDVILSHVPPHHTCADLTHSGLHVGSRALKEFIMKRAPSLVVVGHIHEARCIERIGRTTVVNPGPLFRGYYAEIEVGKRISVTLWEL